VTSTAATKIIAVDTETCRFDRAFMAPTVVCLQWGTPDGTHAVVPTPGVAAAIEWIFGVDPVTGAPHFEQIWFHNGPFDIAALLEWYPHLSTLIWAALEAGRIFDTMYLQRMIQIARGDVGGPLGLAPVAESYGLPPPTKEIAAEWEGRTYDVRTSFHLWYGAEVIPEPWYSYADYDGIVTIQLVERMVRRYCVPAPGQKYAMVNLADLAETTRKYVCLGLSRAYGLRVNSDAVAVLKGAAKVALLRLRETALELNLIRPVAATRKEVAAGLRGADVFCPVRYERRPVAPIDPKKLATWNPDTLADKVRVWERRQAKHANCVGCKWQARDEVTGDLSFSKNTDVLKALVVKAYEGKPPITEAKKGKDGTKTGGGNISTSRDTLQDSENEELMTWAQYNEWGALMSKDMKIFANSPVHTNFGLANTMRPTSSNPNILNFRRTSFYIATCDNPTCGYEETLDPRDSNAKAGKTMKCPICEAPPGAAAPEVAA
jgi:hypothetical protein